MQSVVENLSGLHRKIKVQVPQEQLKEEFNKRINDLAKKANIKGFRKGKVPPSVIKMQFGDAVKQEVIQDIMWETLQQAFKDQNIYPAVSPQIELTNIKDDAPLEYEALFEVLPEVKLDLEGISIKRLQATVEDENVYDFIEKLQKQNVKWNEVERQAQLNDLIMIDFEGFVDDQPLEQGKAENFRLELGSKKMIPGFEDALVGTQKDETVEINAIFPDDYHLQEYAGKEGTFTVTVHKVMAPEIPELNDDFAAYLGVTGGTIEALKQEVRDNITRELEKRIINNIKEQLIAQLLERNKFDIPQSLIDKEIKRLQDQFKKQWTMRTGSKELPPELSDDEKVKEQAHNNVALGLLFSQWIKDNQINVDGRKVRERVEEIASGYHQPDEIINWYFSNQEALGQIEASVLEDQALDKILEIVNVVDEPTTFDEMMATNEKKGE